MRVGKCCRMSESGPQEYDSLGDARFPGKVKTKDSAGYVCSVLSVDDALMFNQYCWVPTKGVSIGSRWQAL